MEMVEVFGLFQHLLSAPSTSTTFLGKIDKAPLGRYQIRAFKASRHDFYIYKPKGKTKIIQGVLKGCSRALWGASQGAARSPWKGRHCPGPLLQVNRRGQRRSPSPNSCTEREVRPASRDSSSRAPQSEQIKGLEKSGGVIYGGVMLAGV